MPKTRRKKKPEKKGINKLALFLLALVLIYATAYSIKFYGGVSSFGDDNAYANFAYQVMRGRFSQTTDILSVRIMQIYPIAFFYWISNYNSYSFAAWDIFSYLASIVIIFFLGKEIYNEYVGVLGSLLFAFFPIMAIISVTLSDNPTMTFFVSLGMLSILYATKKKSGFWYAVAGISFICGFLTIPLGLLGMAVGIFYLLVEFLRKKLNRKVFYFGAGILIAVLILLAFNYLTTTQPLMTFTTTFSFYGSVGGPNSIVPANANFPFYFTVMFPYKIIQILVFNFIHSNFNPISIWKQIYVVNYNWVGFYFYAGVFAILYLLYKKEKRAYFILIWFIVGFLLMEFDPLHISLTPFVYLLQHRLERYVTLIGPPLALLISMALVRFASVTKTKWKYVRYCICAAIVIFLIVTAIPEILLYHNILALEEYDNMQIAHYLSALPSSTQIYLASGQFVPEYMKFSNDSRFYVYDEITNCSHIPWGSYIVISKYSELFDVPYTPDPTNYCPSWRLVLYPVDPTNYTPAVVGPAEFFRTQLYYVPPPST